MGTGIQGETNEYDFGYDFDYSVWAPNTQVDLVNVNWTNDYRDVVKFDDRTALDTYINSLSPAGLRVQFLSYIRPNMPIRLDIPFNRAIKYNYLRASNPLQPITPPDEKRNFYYFILDVRYVAPNTTEFVLQLDVWQTYIYDATLGNCYVERGHIGIANERAFENYGRNYLTVPEGLDTGGEYRIIGVATKNIVSLVPDDIEDHPRFDILVISTADLLADPGTVNAPKLTSADGTTFQATSQGANFYIMNPDQFFFFLQEAKDYPWVTQSIISITIIPKISRYHTSFVYGSGSAFVKADTAYPKPLSYDMATNWRDEASYVNAIPARYQHLLKFKTFPYTFIEMTTFSGTPVVLKPELWNNSNARIWERATLLPPGQRVEFSPRFYNSKYNNEDQLDNLYPTSFVGYENVKGDDGGEYLDLVTQIANFPTMSIVNNGQLSYLASNAHGITFSRQSADWTQQRAMGNAAGQYDMATGAIHTAQSLAGIAGTADIEGVGLANRTQAKQALINGVMGLAGGAAAGSVFGGTGGAAGGVSGLAQGLATAMGTGVDIQSRDEGLAIRNTERANRTIAEDKQARLVRDTNKDLADWSARGDYANAIAGINARVQDSALIQPTTSGQIGGEAANLINGGWKFSLRWKMIDEATMSIIGEIWLRYGYKIHRFIRPPASLHVMSRFTYWKMLETYLISTNIPEGFKKVLAGTFEKGVTVWKNPSDIGNIDIADNEPLDGVSY